MRGCGPCTLSRLLGTWYVVWYRGRKERGGEVDESDLIRSRSDVCATLCGKMGKSCLSEKKARNI